MLVCYAHVSTDDQDLALQRDALAADGCERNVTDTMSGAKAERPGLTEALDYCRSGDTLVVWRLDRLDHSLAHLIELLNLLARRGIRFRSRIVWIDATPSSGTLWTEAISPALKL